MRVLNKNHKYVVAMVIADPTPSYTSEPEWPFLKNVTSPTCLYILGYCRTMAEQHHNLRGRGPTPHVNINNCYYYKCSNKGNENLTILIFMGLYTH